MKVAIIEDEKRMADTLMEMITKNHPDCEITGVADSINSGVDLIIKNKPDIAFFDVEIKDGLSFDILRKLPKASFQLIFTTAHSHYAVQAFEFSAIDYLVKPVHPDKLAKAIDKARSSIKSSTLQEKIENLLLNLTQEPEKQKIVLQTTDTNFYVEINEIVRCEADNNYCQVFLDNGEKIMVSKTLKEYESRLPSEIFFRVHQSHLININKIRQVKKRACKVIMNNGERIPLSARRKDALIEKLK